MHVIWYHFDSTSMLLHIKKIRNMSRNAIVYGCFVLGPDLAMHYCYTLSFEVLQRSLLGSQNWHFYSYNVAVIVLSPFFSVPWIGLQCVNEAFRVYTLYLL